MAPRNKIELNDEQFIQAWTNHGTVSTDDGNSRSLDMDDILATTNASYLLPQVFSEIVKEAQEPLLVGTSLLTRIDYRYGPTVTFPAMGALQAADMAEGQEYREVDPQVGGSTVTANIGKVGLAVAVTEEMLRYSMFDVVGMLLRQAGFALARHKEHKIFNMIKAMGFNVFDNRTPTSSFKGVCTGRNIAGTANGSCTMDDLFDTYSAIIMNGFFPDTLLMHPLMWSVWVKDPILRAFALNSGGGTYFATWSGNPAARAPWDNSSQGAQSVSGGQSIVPGGNAASLAASQLNQYNQTINSQPTIPSYFNIPFRIIVSPLVDFNPTTLTSDIYMFDSSALGGLVVDEDIMIDDFDDPARDIKRIKIRERYAPVIFHEGKGVGKLSNVHVVPNEVVTPPVAQITNLAAISPTASVL